MRDSDIPKLFRVYDKSGSINIIFFYQAIKIIICKL